MARHTFSSSLFMVIVALYAVNQAHGQNLLGNLFPSLNLTNFQLPTLPPLPTLAPLPTLFPIPTLGPLPTLPPPVCIGATSLTSGFCRQEGACASLGGIVDGNCAPGFGVCCTSPLKCGGTTLLNNTWFSNQDYPNATTTGTICTHTVTRLSNVAQLRIELHSFDLPEPDNNGRCTDFFNIAGANPSFVGPRICGQNSGQHIIVPVDQVALNGQITLGFSISSGRPSRWLLKVIFIEDWNVNRAPSGCLQYYYGQPTGTIQSFNYDNTRGVGLTAIQGLRYAMCFRNEAGFCSINFTPSNRRVRRSQYASYPNTYYAQPAHTYEPSQQYVNVQGQYRRPVAPQQSRPNNYYQYPVTYGKQVYGPISYGPYRAPYDTTFNSAWSPSTNTSQYVPPLAPADSTSAPSATDAPLNTTQISDIPAIGGGSCAGQDSIFFPPNQVVCPIQGLRPTSINIRPYIVYVDDNGSQRSRGFSYRYDYVSC